MNKEQFVNYMNKKLQVIREDERKDIIDEYINHIDMKVSEGKTEEEAIADFGDIDEMIREILEAYNIDPRQSRPHKDSFEHKLNDFLDALFEGFKNLLSSVTKLDVDNIVRLIFEILIVLVLLALLKIPFYAVAGLGASLLHGLFGFGFGSLISGMWSLLIKLMYFVTFVVVLVNICTKRVHRYRNRQDDTPIMDDIKESFNFQQAKEAVHRFTEGNMKAEKKDSFTESNRGPNYYEADDEDAVFEEEAAYQEEPYQNRREQRYEHRYESGGIGDGLMTTFRILMKIFAFVFSLPFLAIMIGLCCALGFMVVLSIQGVTIWGFYLIVIGAIVGTSSILSLIYRYIGKGGKD